MTFGEALDIASEDLIAHSDPRKIEAGRVIARWKRVAERGPQSVRMLLVLQPPPWPDEFERGTN